ncbi:leucine-rich repeat transmembrane neuronal protein 4-like [Periplaneta americana]|uniref:leucine-rich repeat transmembrane neuronal protein 4-like n=1 Tax=Periplaneta americana TaxID=6978 RepID=UPI0037E8D298
MTRFINIMKNAVRRFILIHAMMVTFCTQRVISSCPAECTCPNIKNDWNLTLIVQCKNRNLYYVPKTSSAPNVNILLLSYNRIHELNIHDFKGYVNVFKLDIRNSAVTSIHSLTFHEMKHLKSIDISNNNLGYISPRIFEENIELENVSLGNNPLSMIQSNSPILISNSITFLDLSRSKITKLYPESFSNLTSLKFLDLSSNRIKDISQDTAVSLLRNSQVNFNNNLFKCHPHFKRLVCSLYEKSGSQVSHLMCELKKGHRGVFSPSDQEKMCQKYISRSESPKYNETTSSVVETFFPIILLTTAVNHSDGSTLPMKYAPLENISVETSYNISAIEESSKDDSIPDHSSTKLFSFPTIPTPTTKATILSHDNMSSGFALIIIICIVSTILPLLCVILLYGRIKVKNNSSRKERDKFYWYNSERFLVYDKGAISDNSHNDE